MSPALALLSLVLSSGSCRELPLPPIESGGSLELWIDAPAYDWTAYGLVWAGSGEEAAAAMVKSFPVPSMAEDFFGPCNRDSTPGPKPPAAPWIEVVAPDKICACCHS